MIMGPRGGDLEAKDIVRALHFPGTAVVVCFFSSAMADWAIQEPCRGVWRCQEGAITDPSEGGWR